MLVIIGGGNMGTALVQGVLRSGHEPTTITIVEVNQERRRELSRMFAKVVVVDSIPNCRDVVVAVKPHDAAQVCADAAARGAKRLISIAAGVRIATLQKASGDTVRVVRAMPNTAALVGLAATAMAVAPSCDGADRAWARGLLEAIGMVVELDESRLDAFTGLVGSGPAYVFYLAEALREAAVAQGFDAETSATLVAQVLAGSAALLQREPHGAEQLRQRVTSPNGTTAAGVAALDVGRVREAVVAAVRAATLRSKELGNE